MEQPTTLPQPVEVSPPKKGRPKGSKNKKAKRRPVVAGADSEVTKDPVPADVPRQVPAKGKLKYWQRRSNFLKQRGTTPRDFLGRDENPFEIIASPEVQKNVHFFWPSDPFWQRNLVLPGFNRDMYEPVGPELMDELGIKVRTKDRTQDGVPKVGQDAFLMCCPMDLYREQEAIMRGKPLEEIVQDEQKSSEAKMAHDGDLTKPIGGHEVSRDIDDITQREAASRDVGGPIN